MGATYAEGQRVEILRRDFTVGPGVPVPQVWKSGTVDRIDPDGKLVDVVVLLDDGTRTAERVGPRGGNRNIRSA